MAYRSPPTMLGGIGLLLVAALALYFGVKDLLRNRQFDGTPRESTARIERVWWSLGRYSGGFHANLNYVTADGAGENVAISVMPETYSRLHVGDLVPIEYFLQNPGDAWINWPSEGKRFWWLKDAGILVAAAIAFFLGLFSIQLSRPQSEKSWEEAAVDMKPLRRDE